MKKKSVLIIGMLLACFLSALVVFAQKGNRFIKELFNCNVEALACTFHTGFCDEVSNSCETICPVCGQSVYAAGKKGPARGVKGSIIHQDDGE